MSHSCPTTRVVSNNEQGFVVINASDYSPAVHTLYEEPPVAPVAPVAPVEPTPVVTKFTKKAQ